MNSSDNLNFINRILNRISKENSQVLIDQLVSKCQLLDKNDSIVFIDRVFEKVVEEPNTSQTYNTQIINKLSPIFLQNNLLNMGNTLVDNFNREYKKLIDSCKNDSSFDINNGKQKFLNICKFMGECYYTLPNSFLVDIIEDHLPTLTKDTVDDITPFQLMQVEIIATLFTSSGKTIESMGGFTVCNNNNNNYNNNNNNNNSETTSENNTSNKNNNSKAYHLLYQNDRENDLHFKGIQNALDNATPVLSVLIENRQLLPPRVRFMVKNLFELKNNKWIIPKATNDDLNAQKEIVKIATVYGKAIGKSLSEKCQDDSTLNSIFWKSFFQTLGVTNYKVLRQLMMDDKSNISPSSTSPTIPLSPFLRRSMNITSPSQFNLNSNLSTPTSQMDIDSLSSSNSSCSFDLNSSGGVGNINNQQMDSFSLQQQSFSLSTNPQQQFNGTPSIDINLIGNMLNNITSQQQSGFLQQNASSPSLSSNNKQPNNSGTTTNATLNKIKESPELSSAPDSNLSVIIGIIDSKIWTPQKEIWKKKIMNKIIPIKSTLKKAQKIEILAAIWQNMCDNNYEYGSYLDLCLNLIKMDEGDISALYNIDGGNNPLAAPPPQTVGGKPIAPPQQQPTEPVNPLLNKIKGPNRRSSMVTLQMKPNAPGISEARRSSISVPFELNRRGSLSGDIPSYCPPAPKLKSTPTLKSTPAIIQNGGTTTSTTTTTNTTTNNTNNASLATKNIHPTSEPKKQPNPKKHKPDLDNFKDVLICSLQDDFALKMFVKKRSLTTYMELLKDLYREFIIEIPLLLKCISLVHNGLYELTDEECTLLFDLEEMAQEQQNLEKQNDQQQNLLTQNNQIFQWKTNTWEEKPQTPPPPPSSYFDLGSDVFVL